MSTHYQWCVWKEHANLLLINIGVCGCFFFGHLDAWLMMILKHFASKYKTLKVMINSILKAFIPALSPYFTKYLCVTSPVQVGVWARERVSEWARTPHITSHPPSVRVSISKATYDRPTVFVYFYHMLLPTLWVNTVSIVPFHCIIRTGATYGISRIVV